MDGVGLGCLLDVRGRYAFCTYIRKAQTAAVLPVSHWRLSSDRWEGFMVVGFV